MLGLCLFQVSLSLIMCILLYVVTLYSLAKPTASVAEDTDYIGHRLETATSRASPKESTKITESLVTIDLEFKRVIDTFQKDM